MALAVKELEEVEELGPEQDVTEYLFRWTPPPDLDVEVGWLKDTGRKRTFPGGPCWESRTAR
jgi:hypothetical protein